MEAYAHRFYIPMEERPPTVRHWPIDNRHDYNEIQVYDLSFDNSPTELGSVLTTVTRRQLYNMFRENNMGFWNVKSSRPGTAIVRASRFEGL